MATLRPYQDQAIHLLRSSMATGHRRPLLCVPTGGGKTLISTEIIRSAQSKGKQVGFIVDRLQLVQQACDALEAAGIDHGVIQGDHDKTDRSKSVQVISVQTLARRRWPESDLFIIDEAHILHKAHKDILTRWNAVPVIGLSATPWAKGLAKWFDDLVIPTDIASLIRDGYLVDADVYAPDVPDLTGIKTAAGDYEKRELERRMTKLGLVANIHTTWARLAAGRRTLVMATSVAHSQQIVDTFLLAGVPAAHIDAHTKPELRAEVIADFRAGRTLVLSSVGVLTTGFDAPEAEALVLARPTKSLILHFQMVGRVLRPAEGKERALILDHAGNFERLGWHTDVVPHELDDGTGSALKKAQEKRDEKKPITCPSCFTVRQGGRVCPSCGHVAKRENTVHESAGELKKLDSASAKRNRLDSDAAKREMLAGLTWHAAEKAYKPGWAAVKYKDIYGTWPPKHIESVAPEPPTPRVNSFIRSFQIRYAKGKAKQFGRRV